MIITYILMISIMIIVQINGLNYQPQHSWTMQKVKGG